jgi:23S rRNA (guanosine2251-2'-O)-methyltransferase
MQLEGKHAVLEALRSGMRLERLFLLSGAKPDRILAEITRRAAQQDTLVEQVARRDLDRMSERGSHQGLIAVAAPFSFTPLTALIASFAPEEARLVVVLDHLTDPGNVGAIARSAEVGGAAGLVMARTRAAALTPAAHKAAAGAFAHLPVAEVTNIARALEALKQAGFWVAGASEHATTLAWDSALSGNIALVLGAEGTGLSRLVAERCDFLVKLPQVGQVASLNVAQAACALMYEWRRQNRAIEERGEGTSSEAPDY